MKFVSFFRLLSFITFYFIYGCTSQNSPSNIQSKANMIVGSWSGDKFFTYWSGDTLRVAKNWITQMNFKADGSFHLIYATDSGLGRGGNWNLENDGNVIRLTSDSLHTGIFAIVELSSSRFVFGYTSSNGYSLVPLLR